MSNYLLRQGCGNRPDPATKKTV